MFWWNVGFGTCIALIFGALMGFMWIQMGLGNPIDDIKLHFWAKRTFNLAPSANPIFEQEVIQYVDQLLIERDMCLEDREIYPQRAWQYLEKKAPEYEMLRSLMWKFGLDRAEEYAIQTGLIERKVIMWL